MPMRRIAAVVGPSVLTICRLPGRLDMSSLKAIAPVVPVFRREREVFGELVPYGHHEARARAASESSCD